MKLTYNKKTIVFLLLVATLGFILYGLAYGNLWREIKALKSEVRIKTSEVDRLSSIESESKRLNNEIHKLDSKISSPDIIPNIHGFEGGLITLFEDTLKDIGLVTDMRFEKIEIYDDFEVVIATLSMEAHYNDIKNILKEIVGAPIPLVIDEIRIEQIEVDHGEGPYDRTLDVKIKGIAQKNDYSS